MNTKTQTMFAELPAWTYEGATPSWYTLATAICLAGLEGKWIKLSAATQRAVLGANWIGKQSVGLFDGELQISRKVCFGTDSHRFTVDVGRNQRQY